jgi:glycosyltransferase involved in cell wall biosynthesis
VNNQSNPSEINKELRADVQRVSTISFYSRSVDDAMCVLRILGPAKAAGIKVVRGVDEGGIHFERVSEGDIVVIQRDFSRQLDAYENIFAMAHAEKKPVVMDLDDLLFELPADHPDRRSYYYTDSLLPMLQAVMEADLVTVATAALSDYLLGFNKNIRVFPNYLADEWWKLSKPPSDELLDGTITIGYMGGPSHQPDLISILPALKNIQKKYQPKVRFHFWGIEPPPELEATSQVDWCPPKSYAYYDFVSYFQTQHADIFIAPLTDTLFNQCKSCIKYLEYSSLGVAGIYSKVTPYESVIEDGVDGLLASSHQEWENALSNLVEDPHLRRNLAIKAQEKIRKKWLLSRNAPAFRKIYHEAVSDYSGQPHALPPFYLTLKSLARQIYEGKSRIDQLKELKDQNSELVTQVIQYEDELVDYALSTSWQITRPLRTITGKLKGTR